MSPPILCASAIVGMIGLAWVRIESTRPQSSRNRGDAFGPGSRPSGRTNLRCSGASRFDPYRGEAFGDVANVPGELRAAARNRAGGLATLNGRRPFGTSDIAHRISVNSR